MPILEPLRFEPLFRHYLWGGRRLGDVLGKPIGEHPTCAESWEIVDHGDDQSVVAAGPLAGRRLADIVRDFPQELFGRHAPQRQFPLLFKFLDAQKHLSVQVHPNDAQAQRLDPPDLGKTEAWVILDAEPGSFIYAGLKRGFDRHALEREVERGATELCLHRFEPKPGDCVFIPAGTVHALGAGLLVAEIQQASDTTYRLFDWRRLGPDGKPRPLHIHEALDVIDYDRGPVAPQTPRPTTRPGVERLVECDKFILDRMVGAGERVIGGDDRFHIVAVLDGEASLAGDPSGKPLRKGETALVGAACGPLKFAGRGELTALDIYLP